jgi:hypothetical protein
MVSLQCTYALSIQKAANNKSIMNSVCFEIFGDEIFIGQICLDTVE